MTTAHEIRPVAPDERDAVVVLFAAGQVRPERHIAYLSLEPEPIAEELGGLEPEGWDGVLVAWRDGRVVGALATEHDEEPPRVWWHGPAVADDASFAAVGGQLLEAGRARLPAHVVEEELAGDDAHRELADLAARYGFRSDPASAVLFRRCDPFDERPDLPIRAMEERDRDAVAAIHEVCFPGAHLPGQRVDEGEDRWVLVAERDGQVTGYAAFEVHADGSGYLDLLGVPPAARGAGVGAALVIATVDALAARGCDVVNLTVRETKHTARRLYERLGFTEERVVRPFRRGFELA